MLFSALAIKKAKTAASKRMQVAPGAKAYMATPEGKVATSFTVVEFVFLIIAIIIAWSCGKANKENGLLVIVNWLCALLLPMPYVIVSVLASQCARDAIFKPLGFKAYGDGDYTRGIYADEDLLPGAYYY